MNPLMCWGAVASAFCLHSWQRGKAGCEWGWEVSQRRESPPGCISRFISHRGSAKSSGQYPSNIF